MIAGLPARTQVGIVGGGPAGLLLSHLLGLAGISSVVMDARSSQGLVPRIGAGVLEQGSCELLTESGVGERLTREGSVQHGFELCFDGARHRIPLSMLTGGRSVTLYAQFEIVRDLLEAREDGGILAYDARVTSISPGNAGPAAVEYVHDGKLGNLACEFVAGCDGFQGVARRAIPAALRREYLRDYPFAWFGILVEAPPSAPELVYARHPRGFALVSAHATGPQCMYLQCKPGARVEHWRDTAIWAELATRLATRDGWRPAEGAIVNRELLPLRSFVCEPMRYGRLFLAGDAAHLVPPTAAKGLNLAIADVRTLAQALVGHYLDGRADLLEAYSATCLQRAWRAQRFSAWMTTLLHRDPGAADFEVRLQQEELEHLVGSRAAATALAENYVDLSRA